MQLVVLAAVQVIAVGVVESGGILRANVVHAHCHSGTGGIGVSKEGGSHVDVVERVRRKGGVTGEDVDPVAVGPIQAILHER
jgi:hypothetical protein